jgi:hypothetical protein
MEEATCNQWGASLVLSAKFCRQCGNRLDDSEMTTRTLEEPSAEPSPYDHSTRPARAGITKPTYPPVVVPPQPPAPIYGTAPPPSNKTVVIVVLAAVLVILMGLGVVGFLVMGRFSGSEPAKTPPAETAASGSGSAAGGASAGGPGASVKAPPIPEVPTAPTPPTTVPNPPPAPKAGNMQFPFSDSLFYPNSTVTMAVNSSGEKVAVLSSSDSLDKVAAWYKERIKPTQDVVMPGSHILGNKEIKVVISGGDGVVITLTNAKD